MAKKKPCWIPLEKRDPEQSRHLLRAMDELTTEYPEYVELYDRLLSLGGWAATPQLDPDLAKILERGYLRKGRGAKLWPGRQSSCHLNTAVLWGSHKDDMVIVTGWALSKDGIWRSHSWGRNVHTDQIYETTERRALYFGFDLTPEESEEFFMTNAF